MVVAPIEPNVEITANPIGPQLHAPAIEPIIEPKILPPIFCFEFFRWVILNRFIGITNADNIERIVIRTNPNSLPGGIWVTKKGSKKINTILTISILKPIEPGLKKEDFLKKLESAIYFELDLLN